MIFLNILNILYKIDLQNIGALYVFTTIVYRQQMNRVLLAQLEQLKCNFCTQWFSVHSQFAKLQKYSLNACHKCLDNFKYRLVDPTSFEIYDVVLIKTGIELTNKQHQLTNRFQACIKMHRDSSNLSEQTSLLLKEEDMRHSDLKAQINMYAQPIKERVSETCRKFLDGVIKNWNDILTQIKSGSTKLDEHRDKIIKILSDRYYNFSKDPQKLLSQSCVKQRENILKSLTDEIKKITADKMIGKLKKFVTEYFGLIKQKENSMNSTQNKQNKTPNQKNNLRVIREKLMRNSRVQNNELKLNCSHTKSIKGSVMKSSKKDLNKSSAKNLLKPQPLFLKKQSSEKNLSSIKTARSHRIEIQPEPQKEKQTNSVLDQYRDKMTRLLKEQNMTDSYMPISLQKTQSAIGKAFGQKCLVQYLVQLKMKTVVSDNICQLINENLAKGDMLCYLKSLEWRNNISFIRFVKVKMHDAEFDQFLNWFKDKYYVQILVITNNFLTQLSVEAIYEFCCRHPQMNIRHIYMGNNYIKPSKVRKTIQDLRLRGIQVYL